MTDHPSTFGGNTARSGEQAWEDRAALVPAGEEAQVPGGGGVPLRRGTFAEMIRHIGTLPEAERQGYAIEKAGDRTYSAEEAMALASEPGFPSQDPG